jgi:two-component system, OmpR family, phosphate regulon sensor histidine kinase PhoR
MRESIRTERSRCPIFMSSQGVYLLLTEPQLSRQLEAAVLEPAGYPVKIISDLQDAVALIKVSPPNALILGQQPAEQETLEVIENLLRLYPTLALVLLLEEQNPALQIDALRAGAKDCLVAPVRGKDVLATLERVITQNNRLADWIQMVSKRNTKNLRRLVDDMQTLQQVGRKVTAQLDIDAVLREVVDAAVEMTGAEEGSLLLLDDSTGELYMHAAKNFNDDFVRTFRLPVQDTLPGQVLQSGKPLVLNEPVPKKIKTSYLVHTLIYVPLQVQERIIGVLGVDNRQGGKPFKEEHVSLVMALSGYAAIAIENARAYMRTNIERNKFETILTHIEDGVIVVDQDRCLVMVNKAARSVLNLPEQDVIGREAGEILGNPELIELIYTDGADQHERLEMSLEDGRVFNTQRTYIPEVGQAITMQDITHLKELDRIKSDFVSTVSHDLRSPLTAILGYVELIGRAGPVNETQREFIRRVQFSVQNITSLINDLLDLGRIEAGFDAHKEVVPFYSVLTYSVEGLRSRIEEKRQIFEMDFSEQLPNVFGNPVRLRQMVANLLGNAVKYTPDRGKIRLHCHSEDGQLILYVRDTGPGIPAADQPYIFDKFYRASNIPHETPGTGLGLAIVKSIVENHQGRIWLDSSPGQGTIFTVVLPLAVED